MDENEAITIPPNEDRRLLSNFLKYSNLLSKLYVQGFFPCD